MSAVYFILVLFGIFLLLLLRSYYLLPCIKNLKDVSKLSKNKKIAYLTFDDGPNPFWTEKILDLLKREGIKATFFLVGKNVVQYPDLVRKISSEGHTLGNHSFSHSFFLPCFSFSKIRKEILETEKVIREYSGDNFLRLFRPPHGLKSKKMIEAAKSLNYEMICWDTINFDFFEFLPAKAIVFFTLRKIKPGSIVLFHDNIAEKKNASRNNLFQALEVVISSLRKQGYEFKKIDESLFKT